VVAAFCVPTFLWMTVQRATVGEWSISTNDASAFYAASDPQIQVWNNRIHEQITHLAQSRYGIASPRGAQVNRLSWRLTLHNYRKHAWYHLERIIPHLVMTGGGSLFLFNLQGQERSQMVVYQQQNAAPFTMGNRYLFVEMPQQFPYCHWDGKQGAFVLRRFDDSQNASNLPYYTTVPAVRAFAPLTRDGSGYDVGRAVVFPLVKYASQLDRAGELVCRRGSLTWSNE
jgi:hypothetical protein